MTRPVIEQALSLTQLPRERLAASPEILIGAIHDLIGELIQTGAEKDSALLHVQEIRSHLGLGFSGASSRTSVG